MEPIGDLYREPARNTPVIADCEVLVAGAGPAGCAAALAAARHGRNVLLVEREGHPGGAAVSQLVCRFMSTNGMDYQGVWHGFMNAMRGRDAVVKTNETGPGGSLDPEMIKHVWDALLAEADVSLLYHGYLAGAAVEDGAITGVLVETTGGRRAVRGKRVIDCTGDGVVAAQAGAGWDQGDGEDPCGQACTMVQRIGNVPAAEPPSKTDFRERVTANSRRAIASGEFTAGMLRQGRVARKAMNWWLRRLPCGHEMVTGDMRILNVDPLDPLDLTRAEREGRAEALQIAEFYRECVPGFEHSYLAATASHIGVRASRRIHGLVTVTEEDVMAFSKFPDGIARASWPVDIWSARDLTSPTVARGTPEADAWRARVEAGDYYHIRYGCLVARDVRNLLMAGRCLSADHKAQASLRIQQTCMATGEGAGVAAALSLADGVAPADMDGTRVVQQLEEDRAGMRPAFPGLHPV